jgi:micrococcal nuclease
MKKGFITISCLIIIFLLCFTISSFAEKGFKTINVAYRDIKINVNGKRIYPDVEPFIYNGRTFVPLRVISKALDKDVIWNENTNTIDINNKPASNKNEEEVYQVKQVIDGDTIELESGQKVRYIGINAPDKGQNFYKEASSYNETLVSNKSVRLEYDVQKSDQYGRILAYVFVDDIFVNLELIKAGLAVVYTVPPNVKYTDMFVKAQKEAQEKEAGMWKRSKINLKITELHADAEGDDNKNLNGEWVTISNLGSENVNMKGYKLMDEANHTYVFPEFTLKMNSSVKVYTGSGANTSTSLYWGSKTAIWNNNGDTAFLYDADGKLIDSKKYP